MSESTFKKRCVELMRTKYGAKVVYLQGGNVMQESGLPDCYVCHAMFNGLIEFKGVKTTLKPIQKRQLIEFNKRRRFTAFLVRAVDEDAGTFMLEYVGYRDPERGFKEGTEFDVVKAISDLRERYTDTTEDKEINLSKFIEQRLEQKVKGCSTLKPSNEVSTTTTTTTTKTLKTP